MRTKSFSARMAALEAAEAATPSERYIEINAYMPVDVYLAYFEADDTPLDQLHAIDHAYGFDLVRPSDRVKLHVVAWAAPSPMRGWEQTIYLYNGPDGGGSAITEWTAE